MIRIDVTAQQVLHLGVSPDAGWLTDTHRFVPGSVLRGALAATWLAVHRGPNPDTTGDAEFQRLFEGPIRYGPLYPSDMALRPLSVYGCKYPVDRACREYAHDAAFDGSPPSRCPRCGTSPTAASKGAVHGAGVAEHTRVRLDELERAADGQLFTRRALPAGTRLTGLVDGDIRWLGEDEWHIRLGGRRSTAGLATLRASQEPRPAAFDGYDAERCRLVVRLLAPGIFVDAYGQPSWLPDHREISQLLGVPTEVDAMFARPTLVSGWHARANLPKSQDFAIAAGSVIVLRFDHGQPEHAGLDRLWRAGLGLRRAEGNGWISLQRWTTPVTTPASAPAPSSTVELLARRLIAHQAAALVTDDLRRSAHERILGSTPARSDDILAQRRYRDLTPAAQDAFREALELPPRDTAELVRQLSAWDRTATSRRGRSSA
jgi:CRISPR-associated protein Csx10